VPGPPRARRGGRLLSAVDRQPRAAHEASDPLNLAAAHEAIASSVPGRECIVWRDRRLTWADVTDRTRRLADVLTAHGLGARRPLAECEPWESPHDHVALYLHNGNEYLEGLLGAAKARSAAINVNYRYQAEELGHVLADSAARAVIFHGAFAPTLAEVRDRLPHLELLLQVDDDSGAALLPGAIPYEVALEQAEPRAPRDLSPDDLYVLYTGGTTGRPKGVLWRQADFLVACLGVTHTLDQLVARAPTSDLRALPAPPFMHGAAHWNAISAWLAGGTVVVQDHPMHLDPIDLLDTVERERCSSLLIVGDAFARPLVDELRRRSGPPTSLKFLLTGGALLSASVKDELLDLVPGLRIVDVLGSSETGRQAVDRTDRDGPRQGSAARFAPEPTARVVSAGRDRVLEAGDPELGWLAQTGPVPLGYLGDPAKTAATFPTIDGVRYAIAGDRARRSADGRVELLGREASTINTGGEKVFAEEVEQALKHHPAVFDALVVGRPSPRWGQEIVAVVHLRAGCEAESDGSLAAAVADHLARFKVPKAFVRVDRIERSPSGKPDYAWAARTAELGGRPPPP